MAVGFLVVILPGQPQVYCGAALALNNTCRPKRFTDRFPARAAVFGRRQYE